MSEVLYKQALAVTALLYRVFKVVPADDPVAALLQRKAMALPQDVRKLAAAPHAGDLVRVRTELADFRHWLEDLEEAGWTVPMADFDLVAGRLSRGLTTLKPPRPGS